MSQASECYGSLTCYPHGSDPANDTPIILNSYLKPLKTSPPIFMTTNSAPNTEVSTVACFFNNHEMREELRKTKYPDLDLLPTYPLHDLNPQTFSYLLPCLFILGHLEGLLQPHHHRMLLIILNENISVDLRVGRAKNQP